MYSQGEEEKHIVEYFKGKTDGRLLDIGAFDGKTFSNSLRLFEMGWSGVCYEPSPDPFVALSALHKDNKKIKTVCAAVTPVSGTIDFFDSDGDAVSTTDLSHKKKWEQGSAIKFKPIQVKSVTAQEVVDAHGPVYDFVNIDTENTNLETLRAFVSAGLRFELLCIEHDNQHPAIVAMFPGCQPVFQNAENLIIYHKEWR